MQLFCTDATFFAHENMKKTELKKLLIIVFFPFTALYHTAGSDNIFVQIYMDALPGVPGVS